ncbi:hypothetical protein V8D89_012307 [Ganoderma adspersum]
MTEPSNRLVALDLRYPVRERHRANDKTATIDDLPTELFHQVFEHLECHDHNTLASCTLVCRGWLDISQQHLFSELHVLRSCDETFRGLVDWLKEHATLAGYIRTLCLESRLVSAPPQASLMPSLPMDTLSHILNIVPNLQALRLHQLKIDPPSSLSATNPTPYSASGRHSLNHMEYDKCICEPSRTFELLSWFHIDHLDYDPLFNADCDDATIQPGNCALNIHSMCVSPIIEDPLAAFRALQNFVRPNMLKSFRYSCAEPRESPPPVADFLRSTGQSIVDLHLCATAEDDYLLLPQLPSLQVFRYNTCVPLLCAPPSLATHCAAFAPFRDFWIPHLPADLERLVLYLQYGDLVAPGPDSSPLWGFDRTLLARFPRLQKLGLIFPELPFDLASAAAAAAVCFPLFYERGMLETSVRRWQLECREWNIYAYLHDC